jgi:hypothetical protein
MSIPSARQAVNAGGASTSIDSSGRASGPLISALPDLYVPPEVDDAPPLLDWIGELEGDWRPDELLELLDEFDDEPDELDELDELVPDELVPDELVPDEPVELLDVLPFDDVPESFPVVWAAAPGRTAISAPVTATLAKDTVMVVVFRRRLPCSRSATARAISRLFMSSSLTRAAVWTVRGKSQNALSAGGTARGLLGPAGLGSLPNGQ